eukprot:315810_1
MSFVETATYFFTVLTLQAIGSIMCIALLTIHCYKFIQDLRDKNKNNEYKGKRIPLSTITNVVTVIVIASFTIIIVFITLFTVMYLWNDNIYIICSLPVLQMHCCGYTFGKGCMYLLFVMRLYSVYHDTTFEFNHYILKASAIYVIIMTITLTTLGYITIFPIPYTFTFNNKSIHFCNGAIPMYTAILFVGNDFFITIISLYAFTLPLRKMIKKLDDGDYCQKASHKFKFSSNKITILSLTAVCSTFIGMMFLFFAGSNALLWIDCVVNCICMMLMTPYYPGVYAKLCCGLIKIVDLINSKQKIIENIPDVENETDIQKDVCISEHETRGITETYKQHELQILSEQTQTKALPDGDENAI